MASPILNVFWIGSYKLLTEEQQKNWPAVSESLQILFDPTSVGLIEYIKFLWPPCAADADIIFMVVLCNRAGRYIFALCFLSIFFYIFSWPNLSGRRLDVYHTSTHGVALVGI